MKVYEQNQGPDHDVSSVIGAASTVVDAVRAASAGVGSILAPPRHLTKKQGKVFSDLVGVLNPYGHIAELDRIALAELATLLVDTRALTRDIKKRGRFMKRTTAMGEKFRVANPAVAMREKLASRTWSLIRHFGMTPLARRGLDNPDVGDQADWLDEYGVQ